MAIAIIIQYYTCIFMFVKKPTNAFMSIVEILFLIEAIVSDICIVVNGSHYTLMF